MSNGDGQWQGELCRDDGDDPVTPAPEYDGPSIGPDLGGRPYAEVEEEQRRELEWVTGHEDPHTHGESEPGEAPEPNLPALVE